MTNGELMFLVVGGLVGVFLGLHLAGYQRKRPTGTAPRMPAATAPLAPAARGACV